MNLPSLTRPEFYTLLAAFTKLLETEQNARIEEQHPSLNRMGIEAGRRGYNEIGYDEGQRFVKVWSDSGQKSVKYFVEKDTGIIFGADGWKKYNPKRAYGDLTTMSEWEWGEFYGKSKKGLDTLVPASMRR